MAVWCQTDDDVFLGDATVTDRGYPTRSYVNVAAGTAGQSTTRQPQSGTVYWRRYSAAGLTVVVR